MFTQNGIKLQIALTFFNANHQVLHRSIFRMENIIEGFCDLKDYKSVLKKLHAVTSLSNNEVKKFVHYVKENRNKRKSTALSFEVSLVPFTIIFEII